MDFNALQHKLFALDPTDPAEDLRKLAESAGGMPQESVPITESLVQESVEVQQGTMPIEGDYSLNDFAALAGVTLTESQKTGSAGQAKGKDSMPKAEPGRTKHPLKDKLVGEDFKSDYEYGKKNYNSLDLLRPNKEKDTSTTKSTTKTTNAKETPVARAGDWKGFLKQHTVQLKQISADPKKKKEFDNFMTKMAEEIEEENKGLYYNVNKRKKAGTSRSKDHPKAPTDKAWKDAAKTAKTESVESIKEMLLRKLNSKK